MDSKTWTTRQFTGLLGDVRKTNNFVVHITDITEGNHLDLVIQNFPIPKVELSVIEVRHGNDALKFAGQATWTGGELRVIDTLSRDELDALLGWYEQTYNPNTGAIGLASEYKKNGYVSEFASDGRYIRSWPINGIWLSNLNPGDLDAGNAEAKYLSFTVQVDPGTYRPVYRDDIDESYNS